MKDYLDTPAFDHATITGDIAETKVIAAATETAFYSRELKYNKWFIDTEGIMGVLVECDGNASDTLAVTIQFHYGGSTSWGTSDITLVAAQACNTNAYYRIDIQSTFRNYMPFYKMRIKYQKTGTNAALTVKSRITRV
jgi:hypothetical protein